MSSYKKNKTILVTGGTKGIGEEICFFLLKQNHVVYTVARNNLRSKKLKNYLGKNLFFYKSNLLNDDSFNRFLNKIKNINFDIIINNIGGGLGVRNILSDYDDWYNVWKFNVGIAIKINNFFIKKMKNKKSGKIIHISSTAGINGGPPVYPYGGSPSYACSKAFLNMYIKTLSRELKKFKITVSGILPGPILVKNKHWYNLKKNNQKLFDKFIREYVPHGKMLELNQIIPVIKLLCDNKKKPFNSSLIEINAKKINTLDF